MIGENIALTTYVSVEPRGRANRASIWKRSNGRWLLEFHQGTPVLTLNNVTPARLGSGRASRAPNSYSKLAHLFHVKHQ